MYIRMVRFHYSCYKKLFMKITFNFTVLKLLLFQKQLFLIYSCLFLILAQNLVQIQNLSYCAEELNETIIDNENSNLSSQTKMIGLALFVTTVICYYWCIVYKGGGTFPPTFNLETVPFSNLSTISNEEQICLTNTHMPTGEHFSSGTEILIKEKNLMLKDTDWVSGKLYKSLSLHDQQITKQFNLQAEYIEELTHKYENKTILINGTPDKFNSFDSWVVQNENEKEIN